MKQDTIIAVIIGMVLIVSMLAVSAVGLRDAEPGEETPRVTEVRFAPEAQHEDPAEVEEETETDLGMKVEAEVETTGLIENTVPEEPETRYLNILPEEVYLDVPMEKSVQDVAKTVSAEYGVPWELVMAVCYVESGFDQYATSEHGDSGLMQIAPVNRGWLAEMGIVDLYDAEQNIRAGTHILSEKISESGGDFAAALMRYNRGDAVALEQMRQGIYSTEYTEKVLGKYYEYMLAVGG